MLRFLRLSRNRAFTLIELLIVILIIGILLAIAAPTFSGQTRGAQDAVAEAALSTAYNAGLTPVFTQNSGFPTVGDPAVNPGSPGDTLASKTFFGLLDGTKAGVTFAESVSPTR